MEALKLTRSKDDGSYWPKSGCYGSVFLDFQNRRVIKVYKKPDKITKADLDMIFESEIVAYEKANNIPALRQFVPNYYGKVRIKSIRDKSDKDVTDEYDLELAFSMSYIAGSSTKNVEQSSEVRKLFSDYGITGTDDADYFTDKSGRIKALIDITIQPYEVVKNLQGTFDVKFISI
jgi:hypothetical protein